MRKGEPSQLLVGIYANGYPVSDNITLNCEGVVPSHIKEGELRWGTPFALKQCTAATENNYSYQLM